MGFGASLITFVASTPSAPSPINPADVNANFAALNLASTFTGTIATLSSDGGALSSDASGHLLIGGKMGTLVPGDVLDASSLAGSLILTAQQGITFMLSGSAPSGVTEAGIAQLLGGATNYIQFATGRFQFSDSFQGEATGTYNHSLTDPPDFAFAICCVNGHAAMGTDNPTTNTLHVTSSNGLPFCVWMVVYS